MQKWQSAVLRLRIIEPLLSIPRRYHVQSCRNRRFALAASQASGSFPPNCGCCISPCGGCAYACEQSGSHDEAQEGPIWSKMKFLGVKLALSCWVPATAWPRVVAQSAENQKAEAKFDGSFGCISEKDPAECWMSWITFPWFCPNEFFPVEPFAKNLCASCDIFQKQDLSNPFLTVHLETFHPFQRWKVWPVRTAAPELCGSGFSLGKKGDDNGEPHPAARGGLDLSLFQTHQIPFDGTRIAQWQVKHSDLQDQKLFHKLTLSSPGCACLRELLVNATEPCVVDYAKSQTKMQWDISSISNNVSQTCYTFFKTESGSTSLLQRLW